MINEDHLVHETPRDNLIFILWMCNNIIINVYVEITLGKIHVHHVETLLLIKNLTCILFSLQSIVSTCSLGSGKKIHETLLPVMCIIMWLNNCNLSKVNVQPNWGLAVVWLICAADLWGALKLAMVCVLYAVALHSYDHCGSVSLCINNYCDFFGLSLLLPWLG